MADKKPQEEEIRLPNCVWGWASCPIHCKIDKGNEKNTAPYQEKSLSPK